MLSGKNAVLTGANRGIGNAILKLFVENHANVWAMVRTCDDDFLKQTEELSQQYGVWIKIITIDLEERSKIKEAVSQITKDKLPIDILVNNAGMNHHRSFMMLSMEEMDKLHQVNYFAPMQLIQLIAKRMLRQKNGNIINVGSVSGLEHNVGNFAYASSKAALLWATQTISRELAPYGIRVNAVAPGVTDTTINDGNEKALEEEVLPRMNIKRQGNPQEIAEGVLYLASEKSSFVSGQILRIDGGRF